MTDTDSDASPVRVRGIYATALTALLSGASDAGGDGESETADAAGVRATVTRPSAAIRERFDRSFPAVPATVEVATSADGTGVAVVGESDGVERVSAALAGVAVDTLVVPEPAPRGAVFDARVERTVGGGAVVEVGEREGYLPFDRVDDYVDVGDHLRVQVSEPAAPWTDRRPELDAELRVQGSLVDLVRGESGVDAAVPRERRRELARTTELLSASAPDGWGVEWQYPAIEGSVEAMDDALAAAGERAERLDAAIDDGERGQARRLAAPLSTRWVWFGREARFALDEHRRAVTTTMAGHHRVKAGASGASDAVDFVEAVCGEVGVHGENETEFPFDAVTGQFGPREGEAVRIAHGKPDGSLYDLGRATVTERDPAGKVVLRRELSSSGTYDALGTPREPGDVAVTRVTEGRWWYPTAYRGTDGERKGTYVNVCTPVEVFPAAVRYVDLHVDVVREPDGTVRRVDEEELAAAVERGAVSERLAERARSVAATVERAL